MSNAELIAPVALTFPRPLDHDLSQNPESNTQPTELPRCPRDFYFCFIILQTLVTKNLVSSFSMIYYVNIFHITFYNILKYW